MEKRRYMEECIIKSEQRVRKMKISKMITSMIVYAVTIFLIFSSGYNTLMEKIIASVAGGIVLYIANAMKDMIIYSTSQNEEEQLRRLKERYILEYLKPGEIPFWE